MNVSLTIGPPQAHLIIFTLHPDCFVGILGCTVNSVNIVSIVNIRSTGT